MLGVDGQGYHIDRLGGASVVESPSHDKIIETWQPGLLWSKGTPRETRLTGKQCYIPREWQDHKTVHLTRN